jgi:4'-phosphopantetheinyl transferase
VTRPENAISGWAVRFTPPPLTDDEVHLWRVAVPAEGAVPALWSGLLTPAEQEEVSRKRIAADARRTLTGRACRRLLLASYTGHPAHALVFSSTQTGRPQLMSPAANLEFNVSHSGDWVILGFAAGQRIGVDVERERDVECNDLVSHFFSAAERTAWAELSTSERRRAFYAAWTRKEAYLKALGLGLSRSLDSFTVEFRPGRECALLSCEHDALAPERWLLRSIDLAPGYACALAVETGGAALQLSTFEYC